LTPLRQPLKTLKTPENPPHQKKKTPQALALEAAVQASPGHADAWRLLGTVHAENDDDRCAFFVV